jgi:hypothetical protein
MVRCGISIGSGRKLRAYQSVWHASGQNRQIDKGMLDQSFSEPLYSIFRESIDEEVKTLPRYSAIYPLI